MKANRRFLSLAIVFLAAASLPAQEDDLFGKKKSGRPRETFADAVKELRASIAPADAKRGQTAVWRLTVKLSPGWHTYPTKQPDPFYAASVTQFDFKDTADVKWTDPLKEPKVKVHQEAGKTSHIYEGEVVWERPLIVRPDSEPGKKTLQVEVSLIVCTEKKCLPPKKITTTADFSALTATAPVSSDVTKPSGLPAVSREPSKPIEPGPVAGSSLADDYKEIIGRIDSKQGSVRANQGLWAFMLSGVFWGAVSLITPCVFPMIPITVSFFLKQSEKEHHRPVLMASVYCLTIVVVLTVAAVALLSLFRALSVTPVMNYALGALFVFFALSLFGMYEIALPSGLARLTSAQEGKGGLVGTIFMALTFTIVSFACVAPFLGGFGGTADTARLGLLARILGGLAFSVTFALPFFVLALFPSLLKQLPKSGAWLNSVKVVMGFLELAAALKFFRAGELVMLPKPALFTFDLVLGLWVALAFLCGLYLLGLYRLPHDTAPEHLGVPRLMFSLLFLGLGFYFLPALFKFSAEGEKQRPGGVLYAWAESFLLPEPREGQGGLPWSGNLKTALEEAKARGKLVFVDFTGETCTNCKINEENVFTKPDIQQDLKKYSLVQLYTDKVPNKYYPSEVSSKFGNDTSRQRQDAATNLWFQREGFDTEQLPLYVILQPLQDGSIKVVDVYDEGKINNEAAFAQFLREPITTPKLATAQ